MEHKSIVDLSLSTTDILNNYQEKLNTAIESTFSSKHNTEVIDRLAVAIFDANANGNKVVFMGIGKNSYLCHKLAATYQSLNIQANYFDAVHGVHGDLGILRPGDVVVSFSNSGKTSELLHTVRYISDNNDKFKVHQFTVHRRDTTQMLPVDMLVGGIKNVISLRECKEADSVGTVPTISALVMQAIGDIVGLKVAQSIQLNTQEFGLTHPGGSIGSNMNS